MDTETTLDYDAFDESISSSSEFATFIIREEDWIKIRNRDYKRRAVVYTIILCGSVALNYYRSPNGFDATTALPSVAIMAVMFVAITFFGMKKQRKAAFSMRVYIGKDYITKEHELLPTQTIRKQEITKIVYNSVINSYSVHGPDRHFTTMVIPADINDPQKLENMLNGFIDAPIVKRSNWIDNIMAYGTVIIMLGSIAGVNLATDKFTVALSAIGLLLCLVFLFFTAFKYRGTSAKASIVLLLSAIPFLFLLWLAYNKLAA